MGSNDYLWMTGQIMELFLFFRRKGPYFLIFQHIQRSPCYLSLVQRTDQSTCICNGSPAGGNEKGLFFHRFKKGVVGHMEGFGGQWNMHAYQMGVPADVFYVRLPDISFSKAILIFIVCQHSNIKRLKQPGKR